VSTIRESALGADGFRPDRREYRRRRPLRGPGRGSAGGVPAAGSSGKQIPQEQPSGHLRGRRTCSSERQQAPRLLVQAAAVCPTASFPARPAPRCGSVAAVVAHVRDGAGRAGKNASVRRAGIVLRV